MTLWELNGLTETWGNNKIFEGRYPHDHKVSFPGFKDEETVARESRGFVVSGINASNASVFNFNIYFFPMGILSSIPEQF